MMRYLIKIFIALIFIMPVSIHANDTDIKKSKKIHLYFTEGRSQKALYDLNTWIDHGLWINIKIDLHNIEVIILEDLNTKNYTCAKTGLRGDRLVYLRSQNKNLAPNFKLPIGRPCIDSTSLPVDFIKLKLRVKTKKGGFYKNFTLKGKT